MSLANIVYCQVEVPATGRSLVQRSPIKCGVSGVWVWSWNFKKEEVWAHFGRQAMKEKRETYWVLIPSLRLATCSGAPPHPLVLCISEIDEFHSPPAHKDDTSQYSQFPNSQLSHAIQLTFIVRHVVHICVPKEYFSSRYTDGDLHSLITAYHLCLWI